MKLAGDDYKVGFFFFVVNGCVVVVNEIVGIVKVVFDFISDCILGVYIVGF